MAGKTYADYLKDGNKFNPAYLAPKGAIPHGSKGDNPKHRFLQKMDREIVEMSNGDIVSVKNLKRTRKGFIAQKEVA
jgi:hypothetical protein